MIIKERTKSISLQVLESLNYRSALTSERKREYWTQAKGYEGEKQFDTFLERTIPDTHILNDLMLKDAGSLSQIDSVIITGDTIRLFEVKNLSGEYIYKDEGLHTQSGLVYTSPIIQIRKSSSLIQNLIRKKGLRFEVVPYVVFMDPNLYIYNLPWNKPFIMPYQITEHFESINRGSIPLKKEQKRLIELLKQHHQENYRSNELPAYEYSGLKKGIYCPECFSFEHTNTLRNRICKCARKETIAEAIIRSIEEYRVLFPENKLTVSVAYDWCNKEYDKQKIQRSLKKHYQVIGKNRSTFYC